jgi:hypothetical protein
MMAAALHLPMREPPAEILARQPAEIGERARPTTMEFEEPKEVRQIELVGR